MFKITFKTPTMAKGESVTVAGVGELVNGKTMTFDDSADEAFKAANSYVKTDEEGNPELILGPSLEEAFKDHSTITVSHTKGTAPVVGDASTGTDGTGGE